MFCELRLLAFNRIKKIVFLSGFVIGSSSLGLLIEVRETLLELFKEPNNDVLWISIHTTTHHSKGYLQKKAPCTAYTTTTTTTTSTISAVINYKRKERSFLMMILTVTSWRGKKSRKSEEAQHSKIIAVRRETRLKSKVEYFIYSMVRETLINYRIYRT